MRVILPSLGYFGTKSVELRQPTLSDIRAMHSMNRERDLFKLQIVQRLTDVDLSTITFYDLEYLYLVSAFAILMNRANYSVVCDCDKSTVHKFTMEFGSQDVHTLDNVPKSVKRTVAGVDCEFHVLTAQQHFEAIEYALTKDDYSDAYEDYVTSCILNIPLESVRDLDISLYVAANLYHKITFHGVRLIDHKVCPKCGKKLDTIVVINPEILATDLSTLLNQFNMISDDISFDSFINFTIPEYKSFIDSLKSKR